MNVMFCLNVYMCTTCVPCACGGQKSVGSRVGDTYECWESQRHKNILLQEEISASSAGILASRTGGICRETSRKLLHKFLYANLTLSVQ